MAEVVEEQTTTVSPVTKQASLSEVERAVQQKPERTNIFFLKAHKCASSTVQNLLLRFGQQRGLSFVLPTSNNYIGNPDPFNARMIDESLTLPAGKYNIFAHHSRYNTDEVRSVMYDNAAFITILRHPAQVYESIFSYYKFQKVFNVTFKDLLSHPEYIKKINRRYFKRIGFNQMSFDLGFDEEDFNSSSRVAEFVEKIDTEFDLVMMSEWMEASLILLADLMNWPLDNVMSLKLNSRPPEAVYTMTKAEEKQLLNLNDVDNVLYTYFLNKFVQRIKDYGEERMKADIEKLLHLNSQLQFRCVESVNMKGYGNTQAYKLRDESDRLCVYAAKNELPFTEDLRTIQRQRVQVIKNLDLLLNHG